MQITIFELITLIIAALGAGLGIFNTWWSLNQSRIKLKVVPALAVPFGMVDKSLRFCIQITNLSTFPLMIAEAGVLYYKTSTRGAIIFPVFSDGGKSWPYRLEPRSSISVYSPMPENAKLIKCAYAVTQCGHLEEGNSPALKQIISEDKSVF